MVHAYTEPYITVKKIHTTTVEPPNKGHFGDNINSAVVSFVETLFGNSKCIRTIYRETNFGTLPYVSFVERSIILCPYLGGFTVVVN